MVKEGDITFIYIERPVREVSPEVALLKKLSKETFADNHCVTILSNDPSHITINEIIKISKTLYIAISLDNAIYYSKNWLPPLMKALNEGYELASPVCSDIFEINMPYYTPLTFNEVAEEVRERYDGKYLNPLQFPLLAFLMEKKSLQKVNPDTPLSELPRKLKSVLVPSSLTHRFGDYYGSLRDDLLPFIPHGIKKVLDIGCARGLLGELIKRERGCEVYGVELNREIADDAARRLDKVFCMNIENAELPFDKDIDVVICADLLEHLIDPWGLLKRIKRWLRDDGIIIASIPNTAHYSIILDLLRGRWDYIPWGLLCISHLRFFTKSTIEDMFARSGYTLMTLKPQDIPLHFKNLIRERLSEFIKIEKVQEEIFYTGYYTVAKKRKD
ncbi:MAG: class I SAM-dependent methyltransferase [Thermodesulfovibrionales bacterium]